MRELALVPCLLASSGCEYYRCKWGTWPMDGATGVPLDTVIEFTSDASLPDYLPEDLTSAFTLRHDHGNGVPFHVEVDDHTFRLVPDEPLLPGYAYAATGVDFGALRDADHHWWGSSPLGIKRIVFETGGLPTLIEALATPQGHIIAVFSEPMDLDTMGTAFELFSPLSNLLPTTYYYYYNYNTDFTLSEPAPLTVVGHYLDEPSLVELSAGEYTEYIGYYSLAVRVDPRAASLRGPLLDKLTTEVTIQSLPLEQPKARWTGQPTCSF